MVGFTTTIFTLLATLSPSIAQRPSNTSICDYYMPSILGENTASNQLLLITLWVNTFVLGNYTTPNVGIPVHGFATPDIYNGTEVALLPYFTGAYNSTNLGGSSGTTKLFLDDGGAVPVLKNMSSNGNTTSAQYQVFNHIYQYFGTLLGCSLQGGSDFPSYQGRTSMYEVHKFMDLDIFQMDFFIGLVVTSATSLGISTSDSALVGNNLYKLFNTRCAAPVSVPNIAASPQLQSICIAPNCPLDPNPNCSAYPLDGVALAPVNVTTNVTVGATWNVTMGSNSTSSGAPPQTNLGSSLSLGMAMMLGAAAVVSFFALGGKLGL